MSGGDRQTDRIVRTWLEDGVTQLPDRLLDGVLDQLPDTRQRQPLSLTRRFSHMSSSLRIALAAAAAVVVVAGGAFFVAGQNTGTPTPTMTPSSAPSSTTAPTATTDIRTDKLPEADVALEPGSYSVYWQRGDREARLILTVPDGWTSHGGWYVHREPILSAGNAVSIAPWTQRINLVYPDPCQRATKVVADTMDDLVATFVDTPMHDGVDPIDITVSGYAGKEIHISTDTDINMANCVGQHLNPWDGRWVLPGTEQTLWILDVDGKALLIDASTEAGADASQRAQLRQILESIQIEVS